jgi:hypothetical protein
MQIMFIMCFKPQTLQYFTEVESFQCYTLYLSVVESYGDVKVTW